MGAFLAISFLHVMGHFCNNKEDVTPTIKRETPTQIYFVCVDMNQRSLELSHTIGNRCLSHFSIITIPTSRAGRKCWLESFSQQVASRCPVRPQ